MSGSLFLGIDGGGTSTRARLTDEQGATLGEGYAGTSSLTLGVEAAALAIRMATSQALDAAGLPASAVSRIHAGLGLAGANVPSFVEELKACQLGYRSLSIASDAVAACLGAHNGADGAILILGTGSQGLAIVNGRSTTVGGWGFALSDDGSGAILGRAVLRKAILAIDGLAPASPLTMALMQHFDNSPAKTVEWAKTATSRDYAAFAPLIFNHAGKDENADALLEEALAAIGLMLDRLHALGAQQIALMGGLAALYLPFMPARYNGLLVKAQGDAMAGALSMARRGQQ